MKTTQEHWAEDIRDRLDEAEHEAEAWRRFAVISLAINCILVFVSAVGWFW